MIGQIGQIVHWRVGMVLDHVPEHVKIPRTVGHKIMKVKFAQLGAGHSFVQVGATKYFC